MYVCRGLAVWRFEIVAMGKVFMKNEDDVYEPLNAQNALVVVSGACDCSCSFVMHTGRANKNASSQLCGMH